MQTTDVRFVKTSPRNLNEVIGRAIDTWLGQARDPSLFILTAIVVTDALHLALNSTSADVVILVSETGIILPEEGVEDITVTNFANLEVNLLRRLIAIAPEQQMPPLEINLAARKA